MGNKDRFNLEMVLLLVALVFAAGTVAKSYFSPSGSILQMGALSMLVSGIIMCAVEIADRYMFGAGEDR